MKEYRKKSSYLMTARNKVSIKLDCCFPAPQCHLSFSVDQVTGSDLSDRLLNQFTSNSLVKSVSLWSVIGKFLTVSIWTEYKALKQSWVVE